jgi:zona occludens toxin
MASASPAVGKVFKPGEIVPGPGQVADAVAKPDPLADLSPEQRYVAELAGKGRIRLAALAQVGDEDRAWVQWIDTSNNVIEQLDMDQLRALGFEVTVQRYGVRVATGKHVMVATAWPWQAPQREADPRLYNLSDDKSGAAGGVVSVANDADGGAGIGGVSISRVKRAQGTFPENEAYENETYSTIKPRDGYM